jgi:Protein of unknown function (DUF2794)
MAELFSLTAYRNAQQGAQQGRGRTMAQLYFSRAELSLLLGLYGRCVAAGLWRDYALDHLPGLAAFSVFRHSREGAMLSLCKLYPKRQPLLPQVGGSLAIEFCLFYRGVQAAKRASLGGLITFVEERAGEWR